MSTPFAAILRQLAAFTTGIESPRLSRAAFADLRDTFWHHSGDADQPFLAAATLTEDYVAAIWAVARPDEPDPNIVARVFDDPCARVVIWRETTCLWAGYVRIPWHLPCRALRRLTRDYYTTWRAAARAVPH
jgi:hypothetical protein